MRKTKAIVAAIVGALGAGVVAAEAFWGPDTTAGRVLIVASAVVTAVGVPVGVYWVPNKPSPPAP